MLRIDLSRRWLLIVGGISLLIGLVAFLLPELALLIPVTLFGVYALATGVPQVFRFWNQRTWNKRWWVGFGQGTLSVLAGLIALVYPLSALFGLALLIAVWAVLHGINQIQTARRLRDVIPNEWILYLSGGLSILFGVMVFLSPGLGVLAIAWLVGFVASMTGAVLITLGFTTQKPNDHSRSFI